MSALLMAFSMVMRWFVMKFSFHFGSSAHNSPSNRLSVVLPEQREAINEVMNLKYPSPRRKATEGDGTPCLATNTRFPCAC
uniref:Putative secreted protein n=1 Tax=Anopheles marajoara TaxID=58244 RepID=A0A2M4CBE2_9DIPT